MTFDYFLETSKIIEKYISEFLVSIRHEYTEKRRKVTSDSLVDGEIAKDLGRDDLIREHFAFENDAKLRCVFAVYGHVGVPEEVYLRTNAAYLMGDPKKKGLFESEIEKVQLQYRKNKIRELTREQVLEFYEAEQHARFDAQCFIHQVVMSGKLDNAEINYIVKEKEMLENDKLFLKFGIEPTDIEPNFLRHGIDEKDAEIARIRKEFEVKKENYKNAHAYSQKEEMDAEKAQLKELQDKIAS